MGEGNELPNQRTEPSQGIITPLVITVLFVLFAVYAFPASAKEQVVVESKNIAMALSASAILLGIIMLVAIIKADDSND